MAKLANQIEASDCPAVAIARLLIVIMVALMVAANLCYFGYEVGGVSICYKADNVRSMLRPLGPVEPVEVRIGEETVASVRFPGN